MTNEINEKELDKVSGGTCAELREIISAVAESEGREGLGKFAKGLSYLPGCLSGGAYGAEAALNELGIDADVSVGVMGIGSKANVYVDRATGMKLSHREVVNYVRTGKKTW
jgi:bacteriocin-like protein